jgi:hypothetical protein
VSQEVTPTLQSGSGLVVQAWPAVQDEHTPPLHTMLVPQLVPFCFAVPSTHTDVPVEQDVTPFMQSGSGLFVHPSPAVHCEHTPPLQTRFVPQLVPFGFAVPSTHTDVPLEHDVTPSKHAALGFVLQARPAVHCEHTPPLHTRFVPQVVPFAFGDEVLFVHVSTPVAHEVIPLRHGSLLVVHASPAVQLLHVPL